MDTNEKDVLKNMPLGLGMAIAQDTRAMNGFFSLSSNQKAQLFDYISASSTGDEAKKRTEKVKELLKEPNIEQKFF